MDERGGRNPDCSVGRCAPGRGPPIYTGALEPRADILYCGDSERSRAATTADHGASFIACASKLPDTLTTASIWARSADVKLPPFASAAVCLAASLVAQKANPNSVLDLKSAALTLVALVIKTADLTQLAAALHERFGDAPALLDGEPVAIDLAALREADTALDFPALIALLRAHAMQPIAARGGSPAQMQAAMEAGLVEAHGSAPVRVESAAPVASAEAAPAAASSATPAARPTVVVDRPLRSGQQVYARGADLIVLAAVSVGAEVIADGHIHVYAPLRGRAIAGAQGNAEARIFATCMQPQLVSIAGTYRTTETELPPDVLGKPAQVRLVGDRLIVEALAS